MANVTIAQVQNNINDNILALQNSIKFLLNSIIELSKENEKLRKDKENDSKGT